jgi:hypothetical protein
MCTVLVCCDSVSNGAAWKPEHMLEWTGRFTYCNSSTFLGDTARSPDPKNKAQLQAMRDLLREHYVPMLGISEEEKMRIGALVNNTQRHRDRIPKQGSKDNEQKDKNKASELHSLLTICSAKLHGASLPVELIAMVAWAALSARGAVNGEMAQLHLAAKQCLLQLRDQPDSASAAELTEAELEAIVAKIRAVVIYKPGISGLLGAITRDGDSMQAGETSTACLSQTLSRMSLLSACSGTRPPTRCYLLRPFDGTLPGWRRQPVYFPQLRPIRELSTDDVVCYWADRIVLVPLQGHELDGRDLQIGDLVPGDDSGCALEVKTDSESDSTSASSTTHRRWDVFVSTVLYIQTHAIDQYGMRSLQVVLANREHGIFVTDMNPEQLSQHVIRRTRTREKLPSLRDCLMTHFPPIAAMQSPSIQSSSPPVSVVAPSVQGGAQPRLPPHGGVLFSAAPALLLPAPPATGNQLPAFSPSISAEPLADLNVQHSVQQNGPSDASQMADCPPSSPRYPSPSISMARADLASADSHASRGAELPEHPFAPAVGNADGQTEQRNRSQHSRTRRTARRGSSPRVTPTAGTGSHSAHEQQPLLDNVTLVNLFYREHKDDINRWWGDAKITAQPHGNEQPVAVIFREYHKQWLQQARRGEPHAAKHRAVPKNPKHTQKTICYLASKGKEEGSMVRQQWTMLVPSSSGIRKPWEQYNLPTVETILQQREEQPRSREQRRQRESNKVDEDTDDSKKKEPAPSRQQRQWRQSAPKQTRSRQVAAAPSHDARKTRAQMRAEAKAERSQPSSDAEPDMTTDGHGADGKEGEQDNVTHAPARSEAPAKRRRRKDADEQLPSAAGQQVARNAASAPLSQGWSSASPASLPAAGSVAHTETDVNPQLPRQDWVTMHNNLSQRLEVQSTQNMEIIKLLQRQQQQQAEQQEALRTVQQMQSLSQTGREHGASDLRQASSAPVIAGPAAGAAPSLSSLSSVANEGPQPVVAATPSQPQLTAVIPQRSPTSASAFRPLASRPEGQPDHDDQGVEIVPQQRQHQPSRGRPGSPSTPQLPRHAHIQSQPPLWRSGADWTGDGVPQQLLPYYQAPALSYQQQPQFASLLHSSQLAAPVSQPMLLGAPHGHMAQAQSGLVNMITMQMQLNQYKQQEAARDEARQKEEIRAAVEQWAAPAATSWMTPTPQTGVAHYPSTTFDQRASFYGMPRAAQLPVGQNLLLPPAAVGPFSPGVFLPHAHAMAAYRSSG